MALLRTAQSALANAVQHSGARRAEITLSFMDTSVSLDVVDDGRGFDTAAEPVRTSGGGFGLPHDACAGPFAWRDAECGVGARAGDGRRRHPAASGHAAVTTRKARKGRRTPGAPSGAEGRAA